jgi:hypothetical protein
MQQMKEHFDREFLQGALPFEEVYSTNPAVHLVSSAATKKHCVIFKNC